MPILQIDTAVRIIIYTDIYQINICPKDFINREDDQYEEKDINNIHFYAGFIFDLRLFSREKKSRQK